VARVARRAHRLEYLRGRLYRVLSVRCCVERSRPAIEIADPGGQRVVLHAVNLGSGFLCPRDGWRSPRGDTGLLSVPRTGGSGASNTIPVFPAREFSMHVARSPMGSSRSGFRSSTCRLSGYARISRTRTREFVRWCGCVVPGRASHGAGFSASRRYRFLKQLYGFYFSLPFCLASGPIAGPQLTNRRRYLPASVGQCFRVGRKTRGETSVRQGLG